jgi:hypothetical protein
MSTICPFVFATPPKPLVGINAFHYVDHLRFLMQNTLPLQLLLKAFGDFNETFK